MEQLLHFLNTVHPLSEALKDHLRSILKYKEVPKKEYLLRAGHVSRDVCFILSGLLRCFYVKDEIEVSSWFMKEGDVVFGIESFYDQKPSYESIVALEDTNIYYIQYEELEHIYETFPEFNYIGRKLTIHYHKLWGRQLYSIRMNNGQERYDWLLENHPELVQRVPSKYLATYLSVTEGHLSAIKSYKPDSQSQISSFNQSNTA